jgi:hypothetical protein
MCLSPMIKGGGRREGTRKKEKEKICNLKEVHTD